MAFTRRNFIVGAGGAVALAGAGTAWTVTRRPQTAIAPWAFDPKPLSDVRLDAFRHAILAPNPHNRQPWLIRLEGTDSAELSCDPDKRLPATDPFDRQITIGFGTFIELARIAAAERGFRIDIEPFPGGEPQPRLDRRPVARLRFARDPGMVRDPLFAAIPARRSNKERYEMARQVSPVLAIKVAAGNGFAVGPAGVATMRDVILKAVRLEQTTPRTNQESIDLMRIGHAEVDASPDGIDLSGPMIEALTIAGMISRPQLADPSTTAFQSGLDMMAETYGSIPALVWIKTPGNSRADQLEAGRRYVRANLRATALGLAMHPMSQSLQEYPEMAAHFERIHRLCGAAGDERVQMLARFGYADAVEPAPRWPLEKHLIA